MASTINSTLLFLLFSLFLSSSSARPCKTLFISSYAFSIKPNPNNPNPTFIAVFTQISTHSQPLHFPKPHPIPNPHPSPNPSSFLGFSFDSSSLRDRSKDILSVVVALLFGVGCGALTAATMYLLWSMFLDRSDYDDVADYDKEELKKFGYVMIPENNENSVAKE